MEKIFSAIALTAVMTAVMAAPAFAQASSMAYYTTVPSSRSPAVTSDPSPRGLVDGDYLARDRDPEIQSELRCDPPPDDR